jgi:hypothetical protein
MIALKVKPLLIKDSLDTIQVVQALSRLCLFGLLMPTHQFNILRSHYEGLKGISKSCKTFLEDSLTVDLVGEFVCLSLELANFTLLLFL